MILQDDRSQGARRRVKRLCKHEGKKRAGPKEKFLAPETDSYNRRVLEQALIRRILRRSFPGKKKGREWGSFGVSKLQQMEKKEIVTFGLINEGHFFYSRNGGQYYAWAGELNRSGSGSRRRQTKPWSKGGEPRGKTPWVSWGG